MRDTNKVIEKVCINPTDAVLTFSQEEGTTLRLFLFFIGTDSRSLDVHIEQANDSCQTELYALAYLKGDAAVTLHTYMTHLIGGGVSHQLIKSVLDDNASFAFQGTIQIVHHAVPTEATQTNRNLLLSPTAHLRTQPQLIINADDVKATHGTTIGQLDEAALFYMLQRGIDPIEARRLLIEAFCEEVVAPISDTAQHDYITSLLR